MQARIRKFLILLVAFNVAVLTLLVLAQVKGLLSPRAFALTAMAWMVAGFAITLRFFRKLNADRRSGLIVEKTPDTHDIQRIRNSIRTLRLPAIALPIIFIFAWYTWLRDRDVPIFAMLTGSAINVWLTSTFYLAMRREQAKLKEIEAAIGTPTKAIH